VENEVNDVLYLPTADMIANTLTKGFAKPKFEKFRDAMGVLYTAERQQCTLNSPDELFHLRGCVESSNENCLFIPTDAPPLQLRVAMVIVTSNY
jgi:hypothetical protein